MRRMFAPLQVMNSPRKQYWFPAKRYGWGWGMPTVWQGWAVLIGYVVAVWLIASFAPPATDPKTFWGLLALATVPLAVVLWRKGEPPRWRWGG